MSLYVDIKKDFGKFKLDITFEAGNEILALLGASGCGKSMTLKCIAGIVKPDSGKIILEGETLFDSEKNINLPAQKRNVGLLFQSYALFPNMTLEENILTGIREKIPRRQKREKAKEYIRKFHLAGLEKHLPSQLSGGQQQRGALARILAGNPRILMLDEPFSALDSYLRWQLEQEVSFLLSEFPGTTLMVSHNRDEVYRMCGRIAVISGGRIEAAAEKWDLFANPQTYSGALLTGCKNISAAKKTGEHSLYAEDWDLELTLDSIPDEIGYVGVRAHLFSQTDFPERERDSACVFEYEIASSVTDTFSNIYMVKKKGTDSKSLLRWEIGRNRPEGGKPPSSRFLAVRAKDVLLLK